jgi:hypothetical protein
VNDTLNEAVRLRCTRLVSAVHTGALGLALDALLLTFGSGCGGKSGPGDASPVQRDQLTEAYANAACAGYGKCCESKGFAFNSATCRTNTQSQTDLSAICNPPSVYDAQAAGECLAYLQAMFSSCGEATTVIGLHRCAACRAALGREIPWVRDYDEGLVHLRALGDSRVSLRAHRAIIL